MAIDAADRANMQRMALAAAAGAIDTSDLSTQDLVDAAKDAIVALRGAIAAAVDVDDTSMYQSQLDAAVAAVDDAQGGIDTDTRRMNQMTALSGASETLQAALAALAGPTLSQELVDAASSARSALTEAITGAADLTDTEKAPYQREADNAAAPIQTAQDTFNLLTDEAEDAANAAMAATAAKLYMGIAAQDSTAGDVGAGTVAGDGLRAAGYNDADQPTAGTDANTRIMVGIGTAAVVALSEDKKTTVADLHGWTGTRYTAEPENGGMYEAVVYSHVEESEMGAKFNSGTGDGNVGFDLDGTTGETPVLSGLTGYAALVASPSFDQSAGTKEFELPTNTVRVMLSGSYHGVSGTYYCTPAATSTCASRKAAEGFELGSTADADNAFTAGGWTFKPTNPEARVMSAPQSVFASYGWWIHKSADDGTFTASAFVDDKGEVPDATALNTLQGTATYMGGAAGKYALSSSTGGTNDAGHFTARATLEADFSDNSITGTIDNFMGADGMSRNWSVELKEAALAATGGITRADANDTVWTIGDAAAAASGEWAGTLYDNGADGVPKIGTGTFDTNYGTAGKMVGAFGVDKQ